MMTLAIEPLADLGRLPFQIGVVPAPSNGEFPDRLPFAAGVRPDLGLIVQVPNAEVQHHLERAYQRGSLIGTPLCGEGIGRQYAESFLAFLKGAVPPEAMPGLRVLEVGCGNGYLLHRVQTMGADVLGVDPGAQVHEAAMRYGVPVVRDVFPTGHARAAGPFDLVIHHGVLEHVPDPARFLEAQVRRLRPSGVMALAVPDSSEQIAAGDIAMFLHEHWSYFSPDSLRALLASVGLRALRLERAAFGAALYAVATPGGTSPAEGRDRGMVDGFEPRARAGIDRAGRFLAGAAAARRSVGVFCPGRIINLLAVVGPEVLPRFFDDDPRLRGKYYPPIPVPVEPRTSLIADPVDDLVIMSRVFGPRLRQELVQSGLGDRTRIHLVPDLWGR